MTYSTLPDELREYCARAGLAESTVCVRAVGDSRYMQRHFKRIEALERDAEKIRAFMRDNPPAAAPEDVEDAA